MLSSRWEFGFLHCCLIHAAKLSERVLYTSQWCTTGSGYAGVSSYDNKHEENKAPLDSTYDWKNPYFSVFSFLLIHWYFSMLRRRLDERLVTGSGPAEGWISTEIAQKTLARRVWLGDFFMFYIHPENVNYTHEHCTYVVNSKSLGRYLL